MILVFEIDIIRTMVKELKATDYQIAEVNGNKVLRTPAGTLLRPHLHNLPEALATARKNLMRTDIQEKPSHDEKTRPPILVLRS